MADQRIGARVRAVAAEVLDDVLSAGRSLDAVLAGREERVPAGERALLRMLCFGCLRKHWQLASWVEALLARPLKQRDRIVERLLHVGLFQLSGTRIPDHAAVQQTVEAARLLRRPKHAGLLNAVLRRFTREQLSAQPAENEEVRFNHPQWLIDAIRADWPTDWERILEANDDRAPMWLRVNERRMPAATFLSALAAAGVEAERPEGFAQAIRLAEPLPVSRLPGFELGEVSVQDAAAQLAAPWLLDGDPGQILDACAAPGGKSAHLLELAPALALTAIDRDPERLETLERNLTRLGLTATVVAGDASNPDEWWDGSAFDAILLDAPCSATGVIRRHPDIKVLRRATDIAALNARQQALLGALWPLLKPAGRLLYATCSVLTAENEAVVGGFLDATADAREDDMLPNNNIRAVMRRRGCGYQILPGTAGLDGFYYACLTKVA